MAKTVEHKVIVIDVKGSTQAIRDINALQKHAKNADKNIARMGKTLGNLGFTIKAFIAYRLTAYLASIPGAFIDASDSMSMMNSRLKLVNDGTASVAGTMDDLFEVAERSRGSIDAVSTLYTRLAASSKTLGASQQEIIDFTELVSDTFILSGASASEAASGVTQISQAMNKGKLDGDEFKSIMENNVKFGSLLADTLGVTRGELQRMSKAGEITSKKLLQMTDSLDEVRGEMDSMDTTFEQVGVAWGNAVARMISDSTDLSSYLAERFKILRDLANDTSDYFDESKAAQIRKHESDLTELIKKRFQFSKQLSELKNEGGFLNNLFNAEGKTQNRIDVLNISIEESVDLIRRLKAEMKADEFVGPPEPFSGAGDSTGDGDKKSPFDTWLKGVRAADKELTLFNPKLEKLDELFFNEQISESVYNTELEKLTGNLSDVSGGLSDMQEAQKELDAVIESGRTPFQVMIDQMKEMDQVAKDYPALVDKVREAQAVIAQGFVPEESQKDQFIDWTRTAEMGVKGITASFVDMAVSGKNSFADFAESFLINITKMIAQQAILSALSGPNGGFLGLFPTKSAQGNVFSGGEVVPFATGGVVESPTYFPMSSGVGLMGEAGPEVVAPLKRDSRGNMGVSAVAANVQVNIQNNSESQATASQRSDSRGGSIIDIVIGEVSSAIAGDISRGSGAISSSLEGTYGLNRSVGSFS